MSNATQHPAKAPTVPTPATEKAAEKPKVEKEAKTNWRDLPSVFATEAEAVKAAGERDKGPRRAFKVEFQGKTYFVVSHNLMTVGTPLLFHLKGAAAEIGKAPRAPKTPTADSILAMLEALKASNPEEAARVAKQMKELGITK